MEEKRTIQVTVGGARRSYPCGTTYRTVAADLDRKSVV